MNIQTQFYNAINNSNLYEAEQLVDRIDVTENSNLYVITAARRTDHQMVELLLQHGADPTARSGQALQEAASKYDDKSLALLLPYFHEPKWDALVDKILETVAHHHQSFQSATAVKVVAPYASETACNQAMVHAIFFHKSQIASTLKPFVDPLTVLDLFATTYSSRLTSYHAPALQALEQQAADQQKQRIEEHLPSPSNSVVRKI